jgi:hypothetical protein
MIYTTEQYIAELEKRKKSFDKAKLIFSCAAAAHKSQILRMWGKNQLNSEGVSLVRSYSIKPIYISKFQSPRGITPIGKTGKTVFKSSGKPHKSQYYALGYAKFKADIQRPMLEVFGILKKDFTNSLTKREDSYTSGIKDDDNEKKYLRLTKMKNVGKEAFMLTKEEKVNYSNCVNKKLNQIMRGENV